MVTVNSTVVGMSGRQYYLEKEIGSGGEGSVFVVHGSHMVAKIYKKDIRNRLVIQGIGIDMEENGEYSVTIQAIDTNAQSANSSEGASQPPLKAFEVKGDTIYTAIKSVTENEGKIPL